MKTFSHRELSGIYIAGTRWLPDPQKWKTYYGFNLEERDQKKWIQIEEVVSHYNCSYLPLGRRPNPESRPRPIAVSDYPCNPEKKSIAFRDSCSAIIVTYRKMRRSYSSSLCLDLLAYLYPYQVQKKPRGRPRRRENIQPQIEDAPQVE